MCILSKIMNKISNNILPQKIISKIHLEVSEVTNREKAGVMLHIRASHSKNSQIILKEFGYDTFCDNLRHKNNFKQIWRYQRY